VAVEGKAWVALGEALTGRASASGHNLASGPAATKTAPLVREVFAKPVTWALRPTQCAARKKAEEARWRPSLSCVSLAARVLDANARTWDSGRVRLLDPTAGCGPIPLIGCTFDAIHLKLSLRSSRKSSCGRNIA
jgi:hypothetical protein